MCSPEVEKLGGNPDWSAPSRTFYIFPVVVRSANKGTVCHLYRLDGRWRGSYLERETQRSFIAIVIKVTHFWKPSVGMAMSRLDVMHSTADLRCIQCHHVNHTEPNQSSHTLLWFAEIKELYLWKFAALELCEMPLCAPSAFGIGTHWKSAVSLRQVTRQSKRTFCCWESGPLSAQNVYGIRFVAHLVFWKSAEKYVSNMLEK